MNLEEYARQIGDALRNAHNSKNKAAIDATFRAADSEVARLSEGERKKFWQKVSLATDAGRWLNERQANSSLIVLMQAIQSGLATRQGK